MVFIRTKINYLIHKCKYISQKCAIKYLIHYHAKYFLQNTFTFMIHIGEIIKRIVKEKGLSITEFGKRISTHRRNVYDIFIRESVDTALLQKISNVLEHDFFKYYIKNDSKELIILHGKLQTLQKEIEYLKQLVIEKDKINSMLEEKINRLNKRKR